MYNISRLRFFQKLNRQFIDILPDKAAKNTTAVGTAGKLRILHFAKPSEDKLRLWAVASVYSYAVKKSKKV